MKVTLAIVASILILLIIVASIFHNKIFDKEGKPKIFSVEYPQFLYNSCTEKWAIKTDDENWVGFEEGIELHARAFGWTHIILAGERDISKDTMYSSYLGFEIPFPSLQDAQRWYKHYNDSTTAADWEERRKQKAQDSINQCLHTYK